MPASETQLKFACIVLPVRNLKMMAAFYGDVLGFSQAPSDDPNDASFDIGAAKLCLHPATAPMRDDDTVGPILLFSVPDVSAMREQLIELGIHMGKLKSFGPHTECDGRDPEGNLLRLSNQG